MARLSSVCVYCGASGRVAQPFKDAAQTLGTALGHNGIRLVYGGGHVGLMGIVADSCLAAGGEVIGIIPAHIQEKEPRHTELTQLLVVDSMHTRKRMMVDRADGFIIMPGGVGTLDEAFEIMTWKQLGLHTKPIVFLNTEGFFNPMIAMLDHTVAEGFMKSWRKSLASMAKTVDEAIVMVSSGTPSKAAHGMEWV